MDAAPIGVVQRVKLTPDRKQCLHPRTRIPADEREEDVKDGQAADVGTGEGLNFGLDEDGIVGQAGGCTERMVGNDDAMQATHCGGAPKSVGTLP